MTPAELAQISNSVASAISGSESKSHFDALTVIVSAAVGAVFGVLTTWLKSYRDTAASDCEALIDTINTAADIASEYWLSKDADMRLAEARITGHQIRITLFARNFFSTVRHFDERMILDRLPDLFDALTGGEFGNGTHVPDPMRARQSQEVAAELTARIKLAFSESWSLRGLFARKVLRD